MLGWIGILTEATRSSAKEGADRILNPPEMGRDAENETSGGSGETLAPSGWLGRMDQAFADFGFLAPDECGQTFQVVPAFSANSIADAQRFLQQIIFHTRIIPTAEIKSWYRRRRSFHQSDRKSVV